VPVFGEDPTMQVGVLMPGSGFVPLGSPRLSAVPAPAGRLDATVGKRKEPGLGGPGSSALAR